LLKTDYCECEYWDGVEGQFMLSWDESISCTQKYSYSCVEENI